MSDIRETEYEKSFLKLFSDYCHLNDDTYSDCLTTYQISG